MHDIKIPDQAGAKKKDFAVSHVGAPSGGVAAPGPDIMKHHEPSEKIRVKFDKFVQLVATHDFADVMKGHADEDIIISSNLLTDLANAHEETPQKSSKVPLFFIIGIVIGIAVTYLIIRF